MIGIGSFSMLGNYQTYNVCIPHMGVVSMYYVVHANTNQYIFNLHIQYMYLYRAEM